ncbi:MAG TPA: ABC transporter ATP-binding protein [Gemmataceae bacterium]|nr:ABC transporter ATP-binding protein [Gemmataceae bacterium]
MARIELDRVSLTFRLRPSARNSLKDFLLRRLLGRPAPRSPRLCALREVSLRVEEGERLGVIGHNGAGKSTLLKVLAGIYPPTRGVCRVEGRVSALFDIALGFEPEATGWENIAYRGYLQGETPRSIRAKQQAIADFSELGDFLDQPIRYYSSGMVLRLAFAIATAIDPEVLLMDEVLSVGDLAFQRKVQRRLEEMMAKARLLVLVSHDLEAVKALCERTLWLDHGRVRQIGPTAEVIAAYVQSVVGAPAPAA